MSTIADTKQDILRNSAALSLLKRVGGVLAQDYPYHRFKDRLGRIFSVVVPAERSGRARTQFEGYAALPFSVYSPKDLQKPFEIWVPQDQTDLWREEIEDRSQELPATDENEGTAARV